MTMSKLLACLKKKISEKDSMKRGQCKNVLASGTTVLAIKFKDGVILGADGRIVSMEFARVTNNKSKKTLVLGRNAVGYSGNTHVLKTLNRYLKKHFSGRIAEEIDLNEVLTQVKTHLAEYGEYDVLFAALVVGRLNEAWSIFEVKLDEKTGKVLVRKVDERYAVVGSGTDCVKRFLNKPKLKEYPPEVNVETRMKLLFDTLKYAVMKDYGTGGKLRGISIDVVDVLNFYEDQPNGSDYCKSKYEAVNSARVGSNYGPVPLIRES